MKTIEVYQAWCKKCGICVAFCPQQVLQLGPRSYPVAVYPERCTACHLCELRCPDFAIVVHEDEDNVDGSSSSSG
ncbi:MAG: ferredoxin family protein [Dehalococcoidia bacterium]